MKKIITLISVFYAAVLTTNGQTNFRTNGTGGGSWSDIATWQVESPSGSNNWVPASSTPAYASGTIHILSNDIVSLSSPVTIDQTTVDANGTLSVVNVQLKLINTANSLVVNGTLSVTGGTGVVFSSGSNNLVFNSGSTYVHNRNSGVIPPAIWSTGSLCSVTGVTSLAPSGFDPVGGFYKFIWNCPGQTGTSYLTGSLTSVASDLTISDTNGQIFAFSTDPAAPTINIGGNLQVDGNSRIAFVTSGTGAIVNVAGNFNYNSTNAAGSPLKTTGSYVINVSGNFNMNAPGGILNFSNGNGTTGVMNLNGDFTLTAGAITSPAGRGAINFNKTGTQLFTNTGSISNTVDFTIGSSSILDMQAESPISGTGNLVVNGTLMLGSLNTDGALVAGGSGLGNVRNTYANRTYNAGCKIVYKGVSAQVIGSGHPSVSGVTTEIDNPSGVSFNTAASGNSGPTILLIPGDLILTNGNLNIIGSSTITRSLTLNGNITANSNNITFSGVNTSLIINGTGPLGIFPTPIGGQTIQNLTLNRISSGSVAFNKLTILGTVSIINGTATFGGTTTIAGNVSLASGTVMAFDGQSLSMAGNFTSSGLLSASGASSLTVTGVNALTSPLNFVSANNTLQDFIINLKNTSGTSVQIGSSALNVTNSLTLTDGFLDIANPLNMSNGSTINFNASGINPSSITTSSPSGGPWNLNYSGTLGFTTGREIPASGSLISLSSSNTNTITLAQPLTIGSGGISITAGTFNSGANAITSSSLTISGGTFTAPSSTLTLTGDLSVSGTYASNSGTLIFGGATTISGTNASTAIFNNVTINGTLTPSSIFNIQRNFINNGTLMAGTNTVNFKGLNVQTISGSSNTQFYNLTVNKGSGSLTINSPETITNILTLTTGLIAISSPVSISSPTGQVILTAGSLVINSNLLSLANGASIIRAGGAISTSSPSAGPWNLIYTGATKTAGLEIPASGNLASLTVNTNSGTAISLPALLPLNITGALTTNSGTTFNSGANNVSVGSISNGGTFNAPSSSASVGLTLNGSLSNSGTFNAGSGTVLIGGAVSFTGTIPVLNNLTINSAGGVLTAPSALTIQGNLQNNGSLIAGSGTVTFSGNTAKKITGTSKTVFNDVMVNNGTQATDLSLETIAGADLKGVLTMGASAVFDTDGASDNTIFTLLSTSDTPTTADASIAALPGAGQLPGKITVQRYMGRSGVSQYNFQVWRDISSPVNSTVSDFQNSLPVTGSFTGASSVSGASGASMTGYDETVITDTDGNGMNDISDGWYDFPADNGNSATTSFARGLGYQAFIFGSDPPVSVNGNAKWSLRGPVWNGTFNLPVTVTNSGAGGTYSADNDGWNLVGNPYPSTINWDAAGWTKSNLDNAVYIDDYNHVQPVFASYVDGVGTNNGSKYIAMGQGFWVKANAASPVLTITENVKASGTQTRYFRESSRDNLLRVVLASTSESVLKDEAVIYFRDVATQGFDNKYDALKLMNRQPAVNLSSLSSLSSAKEKYAINALPLTHEVQSVPLDVRSVTTGSYQLSFDGLNSFPASLNIQLKDNFDYTIVDIRQNLNYAFKVDKNTPSTFGSNRFTLVFGGQLEEKSLEYTVKVYPNPVRGILTIDAQGSQETTGELFNVMGVRMSPLTFNGNAQRQSAQYDFSNESNGIYFIRTNQGGKVSVIRIVKD